MVLSPNAIVAFLTAVSVNHVENAATERVDLVEINHFYDDQGRLVFDQIIFYDWSPHDSRFHVRAWRLLKTPAQLPQRNRRLNGFVAIWHDGQVLRRVVADSVRESWTQYDPELVEREFLAKEKRMELRKMAIPVKARIPQRVQATTAQQIMQQALDPGSPESPSLPPGR